MSERVPPPAPLTPQRASRRKRRFIFIGLAIVVPIVFLIVGGSLLLQVIAWAPFRQASGSMQPGLLLDDYFFVDMRAYKGPRRPAYGDLVAVAVPREIMGVPGSPQSTILVKRVVGLPGDQIRVAGGAVSVNGKALPQERLGEVAGVRPGFGKAKAMKLRERASNGVSYEILRYSVSPDDSSLAGSYTVPPGHYFVLGDNRDDSLDSRFWAQRGWYLPAANISGAATYIYWSGVDRLDRIGTALK